MVAHVLTGSPIPVPVQWVLAAALFAGALAAFTLRRRALRRAAAVVAVLALLGTVSTWVVAAAQPGAPPYALEIQSPREHATVPESMLLTVCGVLGDGTLVPATDSQHYLVVFVDGSEVPTVDAWQFPETLRPGAHTLKVELVTPQHHAFSPPAIATVDVVAAASAPATASGGCSS